MSGLLDALLAHARERAATLPRGNATARTRASFRESIAGKDSLAVIAEWKRASPSAGALAAELDLAAQLEAYVRGGAAALSIVTEDSRFRGSFDDLRDAAERSALPLLLKDFVVDAAQIEMAARLGASAVLLIARALDEKALRELAAVCRALELDALVECHDERELERALQLEHALIGVNNRDLDTLRIDLSRAERLLARVPRERVAIAESGYGTPETARALRGLADAVLIGTALLRSGDPAEFVAEVRR